MLASLYDLQQTICVLENVNDWDDLTIGPITEVPLVQTLFKLPPQQQSVIEVQLALGSRVALKTSSCPHSTVRSVILPDSGHYS